MADICASERKALAVKDSPWVRQRCTLILLFLPVIRQIFQSLLFSPQSRFFALQRSREYTIRTINDTNCRWWPAFRSFWIYQVARISFEMVEPWHFGYLKSYTSTTNHIHDGWKTEMQEILVCDDDASGTDVVRRKQNLNEKTRCAQTAEFLIVSILMWNWLFPEILFPWR